MQKKTLPKTSALAKTPALTKAPTLTKVTNDGVRKPAPVAKTTRLKSKTPTTTSPSMPPTREEIAVRAYEIFAARGTGGRELEDWVQAERELLQEALRNN